MPQVSEAVQAKFPFEVLQFDPNQAVAKGAALFGFKCHLDEQIKIKIAEETGEDVEDVVVDDVPQDIKEKVEQGPVV